MEIIKAEHKGCDSYQATGRIDSLTSPQLAEALARSINDGRFKLALDLSAVDYISSAGLRVLIDVQKKCKQSGNGELVLSGVQKRVFDMLEIAGFIPLFRFFDDVDASVAALSTPEKAMSAE